MLFSKHTVALSNAAVVEMSNAAVRDRPAGKVGIVVAGLAESVPAVLTLENVKVTFFVLDAGSPERTVFTSDPVATETAPSAGADGDAAGGGVVPPKHAVMRNAPVSPRAARRVAPVFII